MNRPGAAPGAKRWISIAIAVNLGVLGLFKYGGFLMAQLAPVLHLFGVHQLPHWPLALPFGISFFTFHALSYLIDVYRRDVKAERNLLALALYITMFPQLIAGPIVRFKTIVGELHGRRETMDGHRRGYPDLRHRPRPEDADRQYAGVARRPDLRAALPIW